MLLNAALSKEVFPSPHRKHLERDLSCILRCRVIDLKHFLIGGIHYFSLTQVEFSSFPERRGNAACCQSQWWLLSWTGPL